MVAHSLFTHSVHVQRGDVWQLGKHRLCCGDSTCVDDVSRLLQGKQFALCFTSPPYSDQREYKLGAFDWQAMMCGSFDQMIAYGEPDCHILVNLGLSHKNRQVDMYWLEWLMYCAQVKWPVFGWYVWDKKTVVPRANDGRLLTGHEFIFHFNTLHKVANKWIKTTGYKRNPSRRGFMQTDGEMEQFCAPEKFGQETRVPDSIIRIYKNNKQIDHPAVFPVALPEFIMQTWSQPDDIVYEPFCGSGTSIIAAENLQRRCYAMEIEPTYCQLAIDRWQAMTGQQAHILDSMDMGTPLREEHIMDAISAMLQVNMEAKGGDEEEEEQEEEEQPAS